MEERSSQENNPWANLSTVKNFDKGTRLKSSSTRPLGRSRNEIVMKKASPSSLVIGSLINQLCSVLEKDPSQSKQLYLLLCDTMLKLKLIDPSYMTGGFEFVQNRHVDAICQLIKVARATITRDSAISRPLVTYVSLYQDQFHETGFIAVGGFGSVYKAIHKLDEVEYAIKKIIVSSGKVNTMVNYLEEVKTLAKLNHTNIVPYKQAWIEWHTPNPCVLPLTSKCQSRPSTQQSSNSDKQELSSQRTTASSESDVVSFRQEESDVCCDIVEFNSRTSTEESISSDESLENHRMINQQCTILYIQMALCERTLRQWLDDRTEPSPILLITDIAAQILRGLHYIHSLKVVHHDIKPSNIFISTTGKLRVQLGDFGLACPLQRDSHDTIIGTCMYAAPEQLAGECNPKSDIYSLGIILLELLLPMQTSMECIETVKTLLNGGIPTNLLGLDLNWVNIIRQLIQKNPENRPCTSELLEELKMDKDLIINKLQHENSRLQQENDVLLYENKQQNEIIEKQKVLIQELQAAMKENNKR